MYAQLLQDRLDQMGAEGRAEGEAQERRQALIVVAGIDLDPETQDSCQARLFHCPLDQMPTVHEWVQTANAASDPAQAIVELLRRTRDSAEGTP